MHASGVDNRNICASMVPDKLDGFENSPLLKDVKKRLQARHANPGGCDVPGVRSNDKECSAIPLQAVWQAS